MGKLCLWKNGAPKIVRRNQRVPVSGGFMDVGSRPDPDHDLFWYAEEAPRPGRFENAGNMAYSLEGDTVTATRQNIDKLPQEIGKLLKADAKVRRDDIMNGGLKWSPDGVAFYLVQTDKGSRDDLGNETTYMNDSGDPKIHWRMKSEDPDQDDPNPELTSAQFKAMALAVRALVKGCYTRLAQLEGLISITILGASDDAEAVQALLDIDTTAGWPEKYEPEATEEGVI